MEIKKKTKKILPYIILFSAMSVFIFWTRYKIWHVNTYGIYVIAKKIGVSKGGKNGSASKYEYFYGVEKYELSITDYGRGREYIFVKVLPTDPETEIVCPDLAVPQCLVMDSIPKFGWKQIPTCR